jgi:AcrR family transcriptional regulator
MNQFTGTKKKIYETALRLFAQKGYKSTSMREIAKYSEISVSAIYNHFSNKDAILQAIIDDLEKSSLVDIFRNDAIENFIKGKATLKKVANMFKLISYDAKTELLYRFMMQELFSSQKISSFYEQTLYQNNIKKLAKLFERMMQEGLIINTDPLFLAQEFFSSLFFYQMQIIRLKAQNKASASMATLFEKHTDLFWDRIKLR